MKTFIGSILLISLAPAFAQTTAGNITDYNYQLTDVATAGLRKEDLFANMERKMLDLEKSICANRAHLWAWDIHKLGNINTGKIFIFFGKSIWTKNDKKGYMYHVAPYIVENGNEYVMEASYNDVPKPLSIDEWIENETYNRVKGSDCLEITAADTDLTEYFYDRGYLPEVRKNGKPGARCYIKKTPGYYRFPMNIATHELGKNSSGKPTEYNPTQFEKDEVLEACVEATGKAGRFFGGGRDKCKKHLKM